MSAESCNLFEEANICEGDEFSSGNDETFDIENSLEDLNCEFESIDLQALSGFSALVENRIIYSQHEFGCYEKFLQLVTLHAERAHSQLDDNQRQLLELTKRFNLFCGREQFEKVMLDILKHNREVITDLIESQAVSTKFCKAKFLNLFCYIQNLASNGSRTETLSPLEQSSCILQRDNSNETVGNAGMLQAVANQLLDGIKICLFSITGELINDSLLKNHEARRIHAEIFDKVDNGLRDSNNLTTVFEKIAVLAAKGKDSIEWAIIEKSKLNRARNDCLVFAQSSMLSSIFNSCVSSLIQECDNSSLQTIMDSTYYTKLIEISQREEHVFEIFRKRIEEIRSICIRSICMKIGADQRNIFPRGFSQISSRVATASFGNYRS